MAEFASKGVAGSGLGLGIAGTALGLLNNGGNGNGLLGGLLGGGNQNVVSALQAMKAMVSWLVSYLLLMVRSRVMSLSLEPSTWMNLLLQRQEPLRYTLM